MAEIKIKDIAWLAGILEGEACFSSSWKLVCYPRISLTMTDRDIVERVAGFFKSQVRVMKRSATNLGTKPLYRVAVHGKRAIALMLTLYTFMGERRRARISALVGGYKARNTR